MLLEALEIARGHDGFLRGAPDPVLVTAVYAVGATGEATLLTRGFRRLRPTTPFPSECELGGAERMLAAIPVPPHHDHVLVVIVAIEENAPHDVEEVFAALSDVDALSTWRVSDAHPEPHTLGDAARRLTLDVAASAPEAARIELLHAGMALHDRLRAGAWIGASAVGLARTGERPPLAWRMRFTSADGTNDWTARVDVSW